MTSAAIFDGLETGLDVVIENQINNEKKQKNLPRRQSKKKIKLKETPSSNSSSSVATSFSLSLDIDKQSLWLQW